MSGQELRRRLHAVDPDLHIVSGKHHGKLPKILDEKEEQWWGLGEAPPRIPPEEILAIEAKYSLKELRAMAEEAEIDPGGDKELLVRKLVHAGVIEKYGAREKPRIHRGQVDQIIESIQKAIDETRKTDSIKRIERILAQAEPQVLEVITDLDDLRDAIRDYRAITREGLSPEEYIEEKGAAFQDIDAAAQGLDIDEDALEEMEGNL